MEIDAEYMNLEIWMKGGFSLTTYQRQLAREEYKKMKKELAELREKAWMYDQLNK